MQSLDRFDIDTPEQIALELPLAGIGSRFLALTIDSLLQVALLFGGVLVFAVLAPGLAWNQRYMAFLSQSFAAAVLILLPFCLYWGYFALFEILWQGKTPGKRLAGIRVIHQSGRPMTAIECIGRNLMRGVDILPGMYGVGLVCMLCNQQNRRLGDYVAGTIVVHDKAPDSIAPTWGGKPRAGSVLPELRKLSADDLVLIETYLNRRYELEHGVRSQTAKRIVNLIQDRAGIQKTSEQGDDDFLEMIARQLRDGATFR